MRPGAAGPGAFAIGAAILLAAAALRIAGGWNDLWLDEIWALQVAPLAAGIATVAVAGAIGRRRGTAPAIGAMLTVGASYVLVLYSSEARRCAALVVSRSSAVCAARAHPRSFGVRAAGGGRG